MTTSTQYAYVIEQGKDGGYWAYLPDLPGCTTTSETLENIEKKLREAVELYLSYYRDKGEPVPRASARVGTLTAA